MALSNNLRMYLPTRDDYISVKRDISDNLAIIDAVAGNMDIIVNGNTASDNVTSGQFVTVLNSTITGVTDGIYKAVANVAAGVPFVAANLTSPTSGALNELVEHLVHYPDYDNTPINGTTVNTGKSIYTATSDCYIAITINAKSRVYNILYVNGKTISEFALVGTGGDAPNLIPLLIPLKKGDVVSTYADLSASTTWISYRIIPLL